MIKQLIDIDGYWEVIVYYNVDYNFFSDIAFELKAIGSPVERIDDVYYNLNGLRVDKPGKGLYIRNGRKVILVFAEIEFVRIPEPFWPFRNSYLKQW